MGSGTFVAAKWKKERNAIARILDRAPADTLPPLGRCAGHAPSAAGTLHESVQR